MSDAEDVDAQEQFFFESESTHASARKNEDELGDAPVDSKSSGRASDQPQHLPEAKAPSRSNSELFADRNNMGTEQPAPQEENISGTSASEGPRDKEADELFIAYVSAELHQFEETPNFFDSKHESDGHHAPHAGANIAVNASTAEELLHNSSPQVHSAIQTIHQEYEVKVEELGVRGTDTLYEKEEGHEPDSIDDGRPHGGEDGDFVAIFNSEEGGGVGGHGHAEEQAIDCPDPEPAPPIVEDDNLEVSHNTNDPTGDKEAVEGHKSETSSDSYHNFFSQDGEEAAGEGEGEVVAPPKEEEEVHPHLLDLPLSPELRVGNEDAATGINEQVNSPTTENTDEQQPPLVVEPVVMPVAPMSGSGELVERGPLDESNENCPNEGVHKSSGAVIALPVGDVLDQHLVPSENGQSATEPLLRANQTAARVEVVGQVPAFSAARRRRDHLFSHVPDERDVVRGLVPNPAACYGEADPADIDLEAEDAARNKHATFVRNLRLRRVDTKDYVHSIRDAVGRERIDKQTRSQYKSGWSAEMLQRRAEESKGLFSPLGFDSDSESDYEEGNGEDGSWFRNPMKKFKEAFGNLCCFGNRICCHFNVLPLGVELTHDNCRSPLLCAIIFLLVTVWFVGGYSFGLRDDVKSTTIGSIEPFVPLLCFFMTVSGSGAIPYLIGLAASSFCVYRASVELCDDDNQWTKTMYTHLVLALAVMQLCIVAFIGLGLISRLGRMWCADCLQSVFGSVDGEDEALERFLYSRRLINWRPPLSTAHWKAKLQRVTLDPGRQNRYSKSTRCINFLLDVPIGFLKIPVKLDWSMPAQSPDADTRPVTSIPVFYSIGLSIIGLLVIAVVTTLFVAFDTIRSWIHDLLKNIIINAETSNEVEQVMAKYDTYVAVTVLLFIVVIFVVLLLQAMAVMDAVHNARKGGGNLTLDPSRKIEQLRYAGPYRVLDATSAMFFTLCIFIVVALIVIPVFDGFWFLVFLAPDTISKAVFHDVTVWLFELLLKNIVVLMFQWVFASRFLTDENNLRHPRIFAFFAPIIIVLQLCVNFIRVILSLVKTVVTIPLMFVLPMSYPNSPLHHPLMAIVFLNENANNSLKSVMSAYFLAKTQMHKIIFLGERYGVASNSFRVSIPSKPTPPHMLASVAAEGDESRSLVPKPSDRVADTFNPFGCVADGNEPFVHPTDNPKLESPKTKLIFVSLKAFGEAELYQSQRHLVRLWVLLDYFPERFPRSLTPSASLHPSLERVIFEELLEYVSWLLEPSTTSSIAVRSALDTKRGKDVDKSVRALWENSSYSSKKRTYRKEIVFEIMKAHGLVEDDKEMAAAMVRPKCHLEELNWFISQSEVQGQQSPGIFPCTERVVSAAETKAILEHVAPSSVFVGDGSGDTVPPCDGPKTENQDVQNAQPRKEEEEHLPFPGPIGDSDIRKRYRLRRAVANLYETAVFEAYELLESEHIKRLHQLREEERVKKAWLIHALEHPEAVLIPIQVAVGDGPCGDYVLAGTSDSEGPTSGKGKLLSASFLASISPKGPQAVARDRACWRWRLALTLMLYPALRKQRKHYLRRNSFTPVAPLRFNPTGL